MSFISYSFSSFIIIENDESCIYSMRESVAVFRSKEIWNVSCIFIDCDNFNWQASFMTLMTLYDSIHLWFNFLNERSVLMFLMNNQIMSSNLYSDENILFWFACFFWVSWAFANFFLMKSQMSFIFSMMIFVFCVNNRSLINN